MNEVLPMEDDCYLYYNTRSFANYYFFNSEVNRTEEALQSDIFVVGLKRSEEI